MCNFCKSVFSVDCTPHFNKLNNSFQIYSPGDYGNENPWKQTNQYGQSEDITWLL